jgi:hypothetical protein
MKDIKNYILEHKINEAVDAYRLNEVEVTYLVQPEELILQAPETYQESDVQQYMDDMWLNELPSGQDYSEKFFGVNNDSISDVHFEYDTFEHIDVEPKEYIEWNSKFDLKKTNDDEVKLDYFKIKNLKYIIDFDRFDLVDVDDDTVEEKLIDIFTAAESNDANKDYPIEIKFDKDSLEYRK